MKCNRLDCRELSSCENSQGNYISNITYFAFRTAPSKEEICDKMKRLRLNDAAGDRLGFVLVSTISGLENILLFVCLFF